MARFIRYKPVRHYCDTVCQGLANKTDGDDIVEVLLKVALNTITITIIQNISNFNPNRTDIPLSIDVNT